DHYLYVCSEAARGILLAALETGVPVGFGLLTCDTPEQAWARAGGEAGNKGADAVEAALDLAATLAGLRGAAGAARHGRRGTGRLAGSRISCACGPRPAAASSPGARWPT